MVYRKLGWLGCLAGSLLGIQQAGAGAPAPPPAAAVVADGATLPQLLDLAETTNPSLREAQAAVEAARGTAVQAGLWPNVIFDYGTNQIGGKNSQYVGYFQQEIVTAGKKRLDRAAAERQVGQAEQQYRRTRFDLLSAVRKQFGVVLAAQRRIEAQQELVNLLTEARDAARQLEKAGQGPRVDTLQREIELQQAVGALRNAYTQLAYQRQQLAAQVGAPGLVVQGVGGALGVAMPDFEALARDGGLLADSTQAVTAQLEVARSQLLLDRARAEPIGNLTLYGGYQYLVTPPHHTFILQVDVPLPLWNKNQGGIAAARANVARAVEAAQRTQNELTQQLTEQLGKYVAAAELAAQQEHEVLPRSRELAVLGRQAFRTGQINWDRLLDLLRTSAKAELDLIDAQEQRWTAAAQLAGLLQLEQFPQGCAGPPRPPAPAATSCPGRPALGPPQAP